MPAVRIIEMVTRERGAPAFQHPLQPAVGEICRDLVLHDIGEAEAGERGAIRIAMLLNTNWPSTLPAPHAHCARTPKQKMPPWVGMRTLMQLCDEILRGFRPAFPLRKYDGAPTTATRISGLT